jgi:hypothetical protein
MTQGFPGYYPGQQFAPVTQEQMAIAPDPAQFFTQQDPTYQAAQGPVVPPHPSAPAAPETPVDTSGFFGGGATISWDDRKGYVKGTPRGGQILDKKITNQTKLGTNEIMRWDNGEPRKQMELTLQTSERADPQDDGKRRLFIKGDLPRAAREAMKAVGATDLVVGGWFYAAWVSDKKATRAGHNDQKVFNAVYAPPGSPDPMAGKPAYQAQPVPAAPQQPGPIATAPAQAMANFAQAAQFDPNVQAAVYGQQPPAAAQTPPGVPANQAAAFAAWQAQQQGGQPPNGTAPTQQPPAQAAPQSAPQGGQWNPFAPTG